MILVVVPAATVPLSVETGPATAALAWEWTAPWLGRTWYLTQLSSPVRKLRGAKGTGQVDPTHWWSEAVALDGAQWEGARIGTGEVFLPLEVAGVDSAEFLAAHDDFVRSLDPRREAILKVIRPDGKWRQIGCRYSTGADEEITLDPVMSHRAVYGITWATPDPFWSGPEIVVSFGNTAAGPFFPGPPFSISSSQTLGNATVVNPGDEDSYPVWRITGPFTGFTAGVGEAVVNMTLTKAAGEWVEIDMTRPLRNPVRDEAGVDRWDNLTEVAFEPIPPGATTLALVVNGAGPTTTAVLTFTPRYRRAW